jgi:hypothetical protein
MLDASLRLKRRRMASDHYPLERYIREEVRLMIILERDGSLRHGYTQEGEIQNSGAEQGVFDIPAALALRQNMLIDRLLDYAFDVLGLRTVELRVREK